MDFNALHHQHQPLLIANVWDACSALAAIQTQLKDLLCTVQRQQSFAEVFSHENHR